MVNLLAEIKAEFMKRVWPFIFFGFICTAILVPIGAFIAFSMLVQPVRENCEKARQHADLLQQLIRDKPAFSRIQFSDGTMRGGCLIVDGTVPTSQDHDELKSLVDKSAPPVPVWWSVDVEPVAEGATRPAKPLEHQPGLE